VKRFFLVTLTAALVAAGGRAEPASDTLVGKVRSYRAAHELAILREFADLLAIPNLASDDVNIRRNAAAIVALLEKRGVRATLLNGEGGPPAVYGELPAPGAKRTVVFYAHYDGQPVDPARWTGKPWEPVVRDAPPGSGGKDIAWPSLASPVDPKYLVYARSASDDKAAIVGLATALDALRAAGRSPSVNVKFFFEGEEEAGSPHLAEVLRRNRDRLVSDLWLFCDGPVHQSGKKAVFFGTRGVIDVEITAYGAVRRLHSGHYGNWAPNPAAELAVLIASMRDAEGRITIPGFADDVRPPTEAERSAIAAAPEVEAALKQELGLARTEGGDRIEARILSPALNVRGFAAGDVGEKATNSIPTEATVSIDFRVVPDLTPEKVRAKVEEFLRSRGFFLVRDTPEMATRLAHPRLLRVAWGSGYPATRTSLDLPVSRAVVQILSDASGAPVVSLPTLGGSGPNYLFEQILEAPVIGVPIANHDNNQHASNENIRIGNFWDGIEIYASLMAGLGEAWR
jgi:acetylornithine deacetylase/succinyl-diaminopimelate desuccinylase-like protein